MNILMLSSTFPYPPTRGGTQVRTSNLLKYLQQRHSVTLMTLRSPDVSESELSELRQCVTDLAVFPWLPTSQSDGWGAKVGHFGSFVLGGKPPSVWASYSAQAQGWVEQAVEAGKFDAVTCEHCVNEIYVRPQWRWRLPTLVNVHSSVYGTCKSQLETGISENRWRDRFNLPLLYRYEQQHCAKFSDIVLTTAEDQQQIQVLQPRAEITVIPNGVDLERFPYRAADPGGQRLLFIGAMDNVANVDAVRFFSLEVFPVIRQLYPGATLELVGARPTPAVMELARLPQVTVTGAVPTMVDSLHPATVCVVPMRTGFGIKNKTLEAMAAGTPVVASDRGLEGLAVDGEDVPLRALRANQIEDYVSAIGRLFENSELRTQLSRSGRSLIEQEYTWDRAGERYEAVIERMSA